MAVEILDSLPKHFKDILKMRKKDQEPWMTDMKKVIKFLHGRKVKQPISLTQLKVLLGCLH